MAPNALHDHVINGLPLRTGDILCMRDGADNSLYGRVWEGIGALVPGEIDHCAMYLGPGGRFVEANVHGVTVLKMAGDTWDTHALVHQRLFLDTLIGVAYPLAGRGLSAVEQDRIRASVADWCLAQSVADRPFNFDLLDATHPERAYCSQLIAEAYQRDGINLDTNIGVPHAGVFRKAVFPEEIWNASVHRRVGEEAAAALST